MSLPTLSISAIIFTMFTSTSFRCRSLDTERRANPKMSHRATLSLTSRERGQTLSQALSAASLMACSDLAQEGGSCGGNRYKFLMAVDLRRFGVGPHKGRDDWTGGTVACGGGAIDYVVKVPNGSQRKLVGKDGDAVAKAAREEFWRLGRRCQDATRDLFEKETAR